MKLRTRMMISFMVIGILAFVYLLIFVNQKVKPVYLKPIEDDLVDFSVVLAGALALESDGSQPDYRRIGAYIDKVTKQKLNAMIYDRRKTSMDLEIYVTDRAGIVRYDSKGKSLGKDFSKWRDVNLTLKGRYGARSSWDYRGEPRLTLYVAAPILINDEIAGVVTVGKPTPEAYSLSRSMQREGIIGVTLAAILAAVWGFFFTSWVTRPIRLLTEYVVKVRDGVREPMPNLGRSDIGVLGKAFDEMRDALEGKKYVEQYVQTLTHEIKSPVSAIRGAAELLLENPPPERRIGFLNNIQTETLRIQRIVDRLLELSAIETRKTLKDPGMVDLGEVMAQIQDSAAPAAASRHITIIRTGIDGFQVRGERFLLRLALSNLVQNAMDFTPNGGEIIIDLQADLIRISDTGPGVPDYAVSRVFERFYSLQRPGTGRKSSGLGLSIVRQVAQLHRAEVTLTNRPEGGAEACFRFNNQH